MNPRISKLIDRADAAYIPRYDIWQMTSPALEELVGLIVRDCARICQEQTDDSDATTWADVCAVSILREYGL